MTTWPRHPAPHASVHQAAAAAATGGNIITGRRRIAHEIGKSERTVSRMASTGRLPATRAAAIPNAPLAVRSVDLGKVR